MKKRLLTVLSVILTFLMLGGTFSFAANVPSVSVDKFQDVAEADWFYNYVKFVADPENNQIEGSKKVNWNGNAIMNGTSETTFDPQNDLTRAMFATILARYDQAVVDDSKATIFNDVEVNQWYTGSIGWANEKTIVQGYGDGNFGTNDSISRQDLALMIYRYIKNYYEPTKKVKIKVHGGEWKGDIQFTDKDEIRKTNNEETVTAVNNCVDYGLILGYPDGTFKPTQNITRAETAAIIYRLTWLLNQSGGVPTEPIVETVELPIAEEYDENGNLIQSVTITLVKNEDGSIDAPPYQDVLNKLNLNDIELSQIKGYIDPKTGKIYQEGDTLPSDIKGLSLLYKYNYTVTVDLKAANAGPFTLTARYSDEQADATSITQISKDLIMENFTDFEGKTWNNKLMLTNLIDGAIMQKRADRGPRQFGDYIITTKSDGTIHAEGIDLAQKMQEEDALYTERMARVKAYSGVESDKWDAFVKAFAPTTMFDLVGSDIRLKDDYYAVAQAAVEATDALRAAITDPATFKKILEDSEIVGGADKLNTHFDTFSGQYSVLGTTMKVPTDLSGINQTLADLLVGGNDNVLFDLMLNKEEGTPFTAFSAQENITSAEDVVTILNDRISRDWSGRKDIQSVLQAVKEAYAGAYSVEVKVTKNIVQG